MRKRDAERRLRNAERALSRAQADYLRANDWAESDQGTGRWTKGDPTSARGCWTTQETAVQVQRDLARQERTRGA